MKRFLISGIASGALALTLLAGGYAATANAATPTAPAAQATATPGTPPSAPGAPKGAGRVGRAVGGGMVRTLAELTKLTPAEIAAELRTGKSLAAIASAHGSSADALIKAARAKLDTRLKQAVTSGKITQAQADAALKRFDTQAPTLVNSTALGQTKAGKAGKAGRHGMVAATASVTGLSEAQVQAELKSGKTFAQIAQEHGKTVDDILAKLRELGEKKLDSALDRAKQRLNSPKTAGA